MKKQGLEATKALVALSLLLALTVVLTRLLSIQTPVVRIGFAFLPIAVAGYRYGAIPAGLMAALADVVGWLLFPTGTFFPGFTASAFLTGGAYGLFLHRRPPTWVRVLGVSLLLAVVVDLSLNTLWLSMLQGQAILALLPVRLLKTGLLLVLQVPMILGVLALLKKAGYAAPETVTRPGRS